MGGANFEVYDNAFQVPNAGSLGDISQGLQTYSGTNNPTAGCMRGPGTTQVAFAIGRAVGSAVSRNRLRRRLRAVLANSDVPPGLYLVGARVPACEHTFADLEHSVAELLRKVRQHQETVRQHQSLPT